MPRLIDADELKKHIYESSDWDSGGVHQRVVDEYDIDDSPTVDAVPVSYIRKWIENHPTDYTTVETMLTDWREEGEQEW